MPVTPGPLRTGLEGAQGAFGVGTTSWMVQARVNGAFRLDVFFPSDEKGRLDTRQAPYPMVLFIHGGAVDAQRYAWIARHMASRGYVVLLPAHILHLALFELDNGRIAIDSVLRKSQQRGHPLAQAVLVDGPIAAMGHSLGGVTAAFQWAGDPRISALCLISSFPADGTALQDRAGSPVLSIVGANDQRSTPEEVKQGFQPFAAPRWLAVVDDMNHYDWTDRTTLSELQSDGPAAQSLDVTRKQAMAVIDTWLDASLKKEQAATQRLDQGVFMGVTLAQ